MKANEGDGVIVKGHHVGEPDRKAMIVEVQGSDGAPPNVVEGDVLPCGGRRHRMALCAAP